MPNWRRLFCCCNPRNKATASGGVPATITNSNHLNVPPPPLPGDRGVLTNATLAARYRALNLKTTTRQYHGDNGYDVIGANERHGPAFISGCASAWAVANGRPVYGHCSDGGTTWAALLNAVQRAGARPDQVTEIRVARPTQSGRTTLTADDLEEAEDDVRGLQNIFPNAAITRWFVERGTTTYFNAAGEPSPY